MGRVVCKSYIQGYLPPLFLRFLLILMYYVLENITVFIWDLRPYFFLFSVV